jgi:hypothetical protein
MTRLSSHAPVYNIRDCARDQIETWMTAPAGQALKLQLPLRDGVLEVVATPDKKDVGHHAVRRRRPAFRRIGKVPMFSPAQEPSEASRLGRMSSSGETMR